MKTILDAVKAAMQPAEELGGPNDAEYYRLMTAIANEAIHRASICAESNGEGVKVALLGIAYEAINRSRAR